MELKQLLSDRGWTNEAQRKINKDYIELKHAKLAVFLLAVRVHPSKAVTKSSFDFNKRERN